MFGQGAVDQEMASSDEVSDEGEGSVVANNESDGDDGGTLNNQEMDQVIFVAVASSPLLPLSDIFRTDTLCA